MKNICFLLQDIPSKGNLKTVDGAVTICTNIIFICSVQHAAINFPQYDTYAFAPNMPVSLNGEPPKNKVRKQRSRKYSPGQMNYEVYGYDSKYTSHKYAFE